ncbi:MAG: FHA domain-containing protein [bacterium]
MIKMILEFKGKILNQYITNDEFITIGRHSDNLIKINNDAVSKHHAIIMKEKNKILIEDLSSTNGTYVNQKQIRQHELKDGDEILIGEHSIKFSLHDSNDPGPNSNDMDKKNTVIIHSDHYKKMLSKQDS